MGFLLYGGCSRYRFDDRTLSHLKIAITAKLRLQECFLLSWRVPSAEGSGRVSIWLSPSIPLEFVFDERTPAQLNRLWLEALARSSHGLRGMIALHEADAAAMGGGEQEDLEVQRRITSALDDVSGPLPPPDA